MRAAQIEQYKNMSKAFGSKNGARFLWIRSAHAIVLPFRHGWQAGSAAGRVHHRQRAEFRAGSLEGTATRARQADGIGPSPHRLCHAIRSC